ncbi:MAG: hypothetical protein ACLFOC_00360 [Campylobacterales bacterium]
MEELKAYFRREERYEGLQIVFDKNHHNREEILAKIEALQKEMDLYPEVCENCYEDSPSKCAFYIEFNDDYDREAGDFFEAILKKLDIKKAG